MIARSRSEGGSASSCKGPGRLDVVIANLLPTPRDPRCSVSQTAPQHLPQAYEVIAAPRVRAQASSLVVLIRGASCPWRAAEVYARAPPGLRQFTLFLPALMGMRRSIPSRTAAGLRISDRCNGVRTAIMPSMSTPTAAGMTAPSVASTVRRWRPFHSDNPALRRRA